MHEKSRLPHPTMSSHPTLSKPMPSGRNVMASTNGKYHLTCVYHLAHNYLTNSIAILAMSHAVTSASLIVPSEKGTWPLYLATYHGSMTKNSMSSLASNACWVEVLDLWAEIE